MNASYTILTVPSAVRSVAWSMLQQFETRSCTPRSDVFAWCFATFAEAASVHSPSCMQDMQAGRLHKTFEAMADQADRTGAPMVQFHIAGQHCALLTSPEAHHVVLKRTQNAPKHVKVYEIADFIVRRLPFFTAWQRMHRSVVCLPEGFVKVI